QAALLHSFQVPAPSYTQATLQQLFEEQAARHPDRVALMCGEECLTYLGTNARANQLARALRRHGAGPNRLVGLSLERSAQMLVCLLAILKAGAAYLPLDPVGSATRLLDQLRQSGSELLLTRRMFLARLSGWQGTLFCLEERNAEVAAQS